ncbi:MAG: amino acid permease [Candidatus Omnitrophica bacterium]|nr:amino acid permease [Candidatus Omnitrophota bacterium]
MTTNFTRRLTLFDVFCIASGAMISSGIFILPGLAFAKCGPSFFLSYILGVFFAVPAMLSNAELTTAMPKAGGDYFFMSRSMGYGVGAIGGVCSWLSLSLKSAFALIGMGAYFSILFHVPIKVVAVIICILFILLNIKGVKETTRLQRYLVTGLFILLFFYVIVGFPKIDIHRYVPFVPYGKKAIFVTVGFIFVSYGGLTKIASVGEEVKNPGRNIPLGMMLSLFIVGTFYAFISFITVGLLPAEVLSSTQVPLSLGAEQFLGSTGIIIMAVAAILAFVSTANAGMLSASRYPFAMSKDKILPYLFSKVHKKYGTPYISIIFTGLIMLISVIFLELEILVKVASTFLILIFMFSNIAVVIMRESRIFNYRPKFRSPLYPWMQLTGVITGAFLLFEMGRNG